MTNKTINGVPRDLLEGVLETCAFTLPTIYFNELSALLAAPDPIGELHQHEWDINEHGTATVCSICGVRSGDTVEADGIGEPVPVVGKLVPHGGGYLCWHPAANQGQAVVLQTDHVECVAALQSTIAQLKAENERLRGGVKLPDRLIYNAENLAGKNLSWTNGWNACLDEVWRMNP